MKKQKHEYVEIKQFNWDLANPIFYPISAIWLFLIGLLLIVSSIVPLLNTSILSVISDLLDSDSFDMVGSVYETVKIPIKRG